MIQEEKYKEIFSMKKADLLYLIENLMLEGKIDISDIAVCHSRALESKLAEKDKIIFDADTLLFNSLFTDSLGKPADSKAMMEKLNWLDKRGMHNMDGIMEYLKKDCKTIKENEL